MFMEILLSEHAICELIILVVDRFFAGNFYKYFLGKNLCSTLLIILDVPSKKTLNN